MWYRLVRMGVRMHVLTARPRTLVSCLYLLAVPLSTRDAVPVGTHDCMHFHKNR